MAVHADPVSRLRLTSEFCGAAAVVTGGLVVFSWVFTLPGLSQIHPVLGGMSAQTAFCFICIGIALLLSHEHAPAGWRRPAARAAATLVVLASVLTLGERYGWGFGMNLLIPTAWTAAFPGMPTATAQVFLAFGLAMLAIDVDIGRWRPSEFLSFIAVLISLLALVAFSYGTLSLFGVPARRSLAFHTIGLMLVVGFAILAARPGRGLMLLATRKDAGGVMVRRMLPAAVAIPVLVGWLVMQAQRAGWFPPVLSAAYYALSIVTVFSGLIWFTAAKLHRMDVRRQQAEDEVRRLNVDLERRVVERTRQLETANHELEAFSYSVSHDLRAPLRAIDGFSSMVMDDCSAALGPKGRSQLERVRAACRRMGQLIDDLLSLSRVTRTAMRRDSLDLSALAREVAAELQRRDPERRVELIIQPDLRVEADARLVRIVLENLIGNAWKFTKAAARPRVEVGTAGTSFYVRDNGAGFDMTYAGKLFGPFQRLHSDEEFEGTGIGLATVQRIVRRHGGEVSAEGVVGQGATIYFSLC